MSGPKHTEGPWSITNYGGVYWIHSGDTLDNALGLLCKAASEADAKLIAAAPRLAAALKEIAKGAPTIMPTSLVEREHWRLAKIARAALREAGVE